MLKYLVFTLLLLVAAAVMYYAYSRYVQRGAEPSPVYAAVHGTVIIDAGHGGMDGGAVSESGTLEKELNLEISLLLRDLLEASGVDVILTRDEDVMLESSARGGSKKTQDLRARLEIAEANPDAIFVSIHMNKFPSSSVHGVQLYYSPNAEESEKLANKIKSFVTGYLQPDNSRPLKAAGSNIYILNRIKNPAVLVECGFISNPDEEKRLLDDGYRHMLVMTVASSILD